MADEWGTLHDVAGGLGLERVIAPAQYSYCTVGRIFAGEKVTISEADLQAGHQDTHTQVGRCLSKSLVRPELHGPGVAYRALCLAAYSMGNQYIHWFPGCLGRGDRMKDPDRSVTPLRLPRQA